MWSSHIFPASSCFSSFSWSLFFMAQIFLDPGFLGAVSRVRIQGLGLGFRSSLFQLIFIEIFQLRITNLLKVLLHILQYFHKNKTYYWKNRKYEKTGSICRQRKAESSSSEVFLEKGVWRTPMPKSAPLLNFIQNIR